MAILKMTASFSRNVRRIYALECHTAYILGQENPCPLAWNGVGQGFFPSICR